MLACLSPTPCRACWKAFFAARFIILGARGGRLLYSAGPTFLPPGTVGSGLGGASETSLTSAHGQDKGAFCPYPHCDGAAL